MGVQVKEGGGRSCGCRGKRGRVEREGGDGEGKNYCGTGFREAEEKGRKDWEERDLGEEDKILMTSAHLSSSHIHSSFSSHIHCPLHPPTGLGALLSLTGVRLVVSKSFVVSAAPPSWSTITQRPSPPTTTNVTGTRYMDISCMHDIIMTS